MDHILILIRNIYTLVFIIRLIDAYYLLPPQPTHFLFKNIKSFENVWKYYICLKIWRLFYIVSSAVVRCRNSYCKRGSCKTLQGYTWCNCASHSISQKVACVWPRRVFSTIHCTTLSVCSKNSARLSSVWVISGIWLFNANSRFRTSSFCKEGKNVQIYSLQDAKLYISSISISSWFLANVMWDNCKPSPKLVHQHHPLHRDAIISLHHIIIIIIIKGHQLKYHFHQLAYD